MLYLFSFSLLLNPFTSLHLKGKYFDPTTYVWQLLLLVTFQSEKNTFNKLVKFRWNLRFSTFSVCDLLQKKSVFWAPHHVSDVWVSSSTKRFDSQRVFFFGCFTFWLVYMFKLEVECSTFTSNVVLLRL